MMYESDMDESTTRLFVDVTLEIFLRNRADPLQPILTFVFNRDHLEEGDELDSFMRIVTNTIRNVWDRQSEPWFMFSDHNFNKFMLPKEEVQGISILSPSDSLAEALGWEDEDE